MLHVHINESCCIWMSSVSYEQVMSHINKARVLCHMSHMSESYLMSMSHVSYKGVTSHMNESCLISTSHESHVSHVAYFISMSRVSFEWAMSHIKESCLICMSHVPYQWAMSRMNGLRVAMSHESCRMSCPQTSSSDLKKRKQRPEKVAKVHWV